MKLLSIFLLSFSTLSFAAVEPVSFTGKFTVGTCTMSPAKKAEIELIDNVLAIKFEGDEGPSTNLSLENYSDDIIEMKVSAESFSLTNEFFSKATPEEGSTPLMRTKIARSASGDQVRLSVLNYLSNSQAECVLYRH